MLKDNITFYVQNFDKNYIFLSLKYPLIINPISSYTIPIFIIINNILNILINIFITLSLGKESKMAKKSSELKKATWETALLAILY